MKLRRITEYNTGTKFIFEFLCSVNNHIMDELRLHMSWVPKYTLAELVAMRTKPYLGFIPCRESAFIDAYTSCRINDVQFNVAMVMGASDIIEIGKSLIFHSDNWDILRACCMHVDANVEYNSIARLLLSVDLYSPETAFAICCKAISCAYDSSYRHYSVERFEKGHPVWKWVDTHQSIDLIHKEQKEMYEVVSELARKDSSRRAREAKNKYSVETMNLFLALHNLPSGYLSVMQYRDHAGGDMPVSINVFMRQQTGCVECAIAKTVNRECTICPRVQQCNEPKPAEPRYVEPHHAEPRYAEPAYFAPPPSAPPMEEMRHI